MTYWFEYATIRGTLIKGGIILIEFFNDLRELNIIWSILLKLALAVAVGGAIGLERGKQGRAAGMRTHILVCLGSTLTVMIGIFAYNQLNYPGDPMRVAAQVISGIGFLGAGTILVKGRFQITGITTAAGLWATAAIGLALGAGFYEGAIIAFLLTFLTVTIFHKLEYKFNRWHLRFGLYIEIDDDRSIREIIDFINENYDAADVQVTPPRSGKTNNVGLEAIINNSKNTVKIHDVSVRIEELEHVVFAIESI